MSKMYVIQWKSKVNGRAGRGTKQFEFEEAQELAEELNQEYPDIHHETQEVQPSASPQHPQPAEPPARHEHGDTKPDGHGIPVLSGDA